MAIIMSTGFRFHYIDLGSVLIILNTENKPLMQTNSVFFDFKSC